jgi:hypothetical protein
VGIFKWVFWGFFGWVFLGGFFNANPVSGSGSFSHQAKIIRKTLIPTVLLLLLDFLSLGNDVNVPSKSNKQNFFKKISVLLAS